jgi:cupin fold WbuC family metalloprotein
VLKLNDQLFERLLLDAEASPRKRVHYNIHQSYSEPVQRLCIALKSGTYIRPHCHKNKDSWEMIVALKGGVNMLIFDTRGIVKECFKISPNSGRIAVELEPNTWHMLFPEKSEAVILEVKQGPFKQKKASDFASWAPEENSSGVEDFLAWAKCAEPGDKYQSL